MPVKKGILPPSEIRETSERGCGRSCEQACNSDHRGRNRRPKLTTPYPVLLSGGAGVNWREVHGNDWQDPAPSPDRSRSGPAQKHGEEGAALGGHCAGVPEGTSPRPRLGAYRPQLDQWLQAEEKLPLREQRTVQRLYEALQIEGYSGAVDRVRRNVKLIFGNPSMWRHAGGQTIVSAWNVRVPRLA